MNNLESWDGGAIVYIIFVLIVTIIAVLWIILPFAVFGIKNRLDKLLAAIETTNKILAIANDLEIKEK